MNTVDQESWLGRGFVCLKGVEDWDSESWKNGIRLLVISTFGQLIRKKIVYGSSGFIIYTLKEGTFGSMRLLVVVVGPGGN